MSAFHRSVTAAALGAALLAASCFSGRTRDVAGPDACSQVVDGTATVSIRDFDFQPRTLCVRRGTVVTWTNDETAQSGMPHTTTADGDAWDSGLLAPGQAFSRTFDQPGSFPYHCEPHPFMTGTIIVVG